MGVSNKVNNKSSFKHDRGYDTSTSFQEVPRLFNQDSNTRKKRSDSGEVSTHSRSETKLPDNAPIILTWVPKEKGRSLSDENLQIVIDHVNKYRETREILLCINSSGFESEQKEAIRQKLDERLGDKAQQVKVIDLLEYDWSSVDQGWKIDDKDISIKDYYANMYSKAPGERMYFPVEIDTFRMVALALSEQITGKRGAIYVDFDTLSAIKEPLGQDITIPKGILVGDVGENFVNNDLIAIDRPEVVINFLNLYNYKIESEKTLCQRAKEILELDYDGKSLNDLLEMYARGNLNKALYFLFYEKGRFLIITHLEFSHYFQYLAKLQHDDPYYLAKSFSFKHNGGKYPDDSKAFHNYSWLDIPSRKIREERLKIEEYISLAKKEEASKGIRALANYIQSMGYKFETEMTIFLHLAIRIQDKSLVKDLIEMGDDVNARDSHGKTPLHLASEMGDLSLVSLLLENGAVFNVRNAERLMPKSLSKPGEVLTLLTNVEQAFQLANGGIPVVHLILLKHAIENLSDVQVLAKAKNKDGHTLLSLVVSRKSNLLEVQEKRLEIIDLLVDKGADINFKDAQGNSLLYTAISNTDKEVVGALLKKGAVIDDATKLIVEGMKAIPNPNEDVKAILEKLEQHTLDKLFSNSCSSSTQKRKKRQPCGNSDLEEAWKGIKNFLQKKVEPISELQAQLTRGESLVISAYKGIGLLVNNLRQGDVVDLEITIDKYKHFSAFAEGVFIRHDKLQKEAKRDIDTMQRSVSHVKTGAEIYYSNQNDFDSIFNSIEQSLAGFNQKIEDYRTEIDHLGITISNFDSLISRTKAALSIFTEVKIISIRVGSRLESLPHNSNNRALLSLDHQRDIAKLQQLRERIQRIQDVSQEVKSFLENKIDEVNQKSAQLSGCLQSGGRGKRAAISCILNANEYIERLRELPTQKQISFTRANEIDFIGSTRGVGQAEKVRDLLLSETMTVAQKSYEMDELFKNPREERILDLSEDISQSKNSKFKQGLMNAAGRIQLIRGIHGTFASCNSEGLSTDCALSVEEMGFSFLSQPIENRMLKITPRVVKSAASVAGKAPVLGKSLKFAVQLKGMKFGAPIARGVAGGIGGVFDIVDIGMSANTLIICLRKKEEGEEPCSDMEIRDSIAGITFGSVSFISGVAFTALGMSGAGTVVGLALMVGQAVYSGISTIIEYEEKYDTTHDENWRIFWHRVAFQPIPQDVQDLAARTETVNQLAKEAWKRLANSTDVVAIAMGLGNVTLRKKIVGRLIHENSGGLDKQTEIKDGNACTSSDREFNPDEQYYRACFNMAVQVPHILPGHASIKMNETSDTTKLSRIVPASPSPDAQMLGLPKWSGQEYEYIDKGVEGIVDSAKNPALSSNPVGSLVSGIVAAVAVAVGSVKPLHKASHYSENPEAIYPCDNAFVIANRTRIANDDKNQTILFDLRYVKEGEVIGSNKWKNAFLVHDGHVQIFGGNNTHNTFHLMNETVSGGVFGGKNASNLLDFSLLNSMTILYSVGGIYGLVYSDDQQRKRKRIAFTKLINHVIGRQGQQEGIGCNDNQEMFVNSGGGYNNDRKDWLINCKKAVISPCTEATGGDGNYIFYIKPNNILETVGRSEIDVSGNGTLVFPETALLKDCRIIHSTSNNTLSFEIPLSQNKTFVLEVKNYLNEDKTPKFHLIDKHGSNIVPIIGESESKDDPAQIKSFRLNAERLFAALNGQREIDRLSTLRKHESVHHRRHRQRQRRLNIERAFRNNKEDEDWYRSVSESREDYKVFGMVKDRDLKTDYRIFGSSGVDVIDMSNEVAFAHGGNGCDVYRFEGNRIGYKNYAELTKIDNCAEDRELDVLLTPHKSQKIGRDIDDLLLSFPNRANIAIKNYFKDISCQHLIINTDDEMLIPFNLGGRVCLVPFYHASNSENVFFLPENSTEFVIDAKMEDTEFYRYKGHLLLIRDKDDDTMIPLTIIVKDFYFDQSKWQSVKPYFWNRGEFASFDLSQKAESYEDKIKSDYEKIFKEYVYNDTFSGEIAHNQQRLENGTLTKITEDERCIGVLVFKDVDPRRVGLVHTANDLILFDKGVDHKNLTMRNWHVSEYYRISRVEFDLESGRVVINKLDRFDLSAEGIERMKDLFYRAKTNEMIDRSLKAKSEIANNFQCLITMYGLYKGSNTYKCLGFLVLEDQINFAKAYCNSQKLNEFTDKVQKNNLFARSLILFIIKLHNNLLLNGYSREETARCSNIILYKQFFRSTNPTKEMQSIRNITNTMNSEVQAQLSTTTVSPEHRHRHHHEHRNATAQQRNRRAADENREKESIPSSASRPKPWIKTAFDFATKGIAKLGALIFSSSTASLPIEHPTLSSQQGSTRNSNVTTIAPQINVDGTILLLDVFIRKITGENYVSLVNQDVSLLEIQADALNITKEFGKILSTTFNTPAEELIDLPEVQSKIFKAMMSGRGNEILGILCSYVEKAKLESEVTEKILSAFQPTKPTAITLEGQTKHLSSLPNASYHNEPKSCLSDIKMTDYSNNLACR